MNSPGLMIEVRQETTACSLTARITVSSFMSAVLSGIDRHCPVSEVDGHSLATSRTR